MINENELPKEQPGEPDSGGVSAPVGQEAPVQTIVVEGRELTPDQLKQAYSELHKDYTRATQERSMFARALQDFGLLDEAEPGQVAPPLGDEQPGYGIGGQPTTQPPASQPSGMRPQPPVEAQVQEPALPERIMALEATIERLEFGRRHPELEEDSVEQIERVRDALETKYGIPHRLESVWAEGIVQDARFRYGRQQMEQRRQQTSQNANAAQRQAAAAAAPVIPGSGNPAAAPPAPARTVDEVVARLASVAADEMAGRGHE